MTKLKESIIRAFSSNSEFISTSDIANFIYEKEMQNIKKLSQSLDNSLIKLAKRKKAKLHRKLLYHINKLTAEGLIKYQKVKDNGEKFFALNTNANFKNEKITYDIAYSELEKINIKSLGYPELKRVSHNWIKKIDTIIINCQDIKKLIKTINYCSQNISQAIALNKFEKIVASNNLFELNEFLLNLDKENFEFNVNLFIEIKDIDFNKLVEFLELAQKKNKLLICLLLTKKDLLKRSKLINYVVKTFDLTKIIFQNIAQKPPVILGISSSYSLNAKIWKKYKYDSQNLFGLAVNSCSIIVDLNKAKNSNHFILRNKFIEFCKILVHSTSIQRKRSGLFFKNMNYLTLNNNEFYRFSSNSLILKNFKFTEDNLIFFKSVKDAIKEFCKIEETIFKSCGMPTSHNIKLCTFDFNIKNLKDENSSLINDIFEDNIIIKYDEINYDAIIKFFEKNFHALTLNKKRQITLNNFIK